MLDYFSDNLHTHYTGIDDVASNKIEVYSIGIV